MFQYSRAGNSSNNDQLELEMDAERSLTSVNENACREF